MESVSQRHLLKMVGLLPISQVSNLLVVSLGPPPLSSALAPAPCRWTTDSVRPESKLRAFLLPLELPVKDPVHGSCSVYEAKLNLIT